VAAECTELDEAVHYCAERPHCNSEASTHRSALPGIMWVGSSPPDRHHLQDSMSLTDSQFSRIHEKLTSNVGAISLQRFLDGEPKYNSPYAFEANPLGAMIIGLTTDFCQTTTSG